MGDLDLPCLLIYEYQSHFVEEVLLDAIDDLQRAIDSLTWGVGWTVH